MADEKKSSDFNIEIPSQVAFPDQGPECTCGDDDEWWWINCMYHVESGYGAHEVGYGCFRCGAHHFYQPDWANAKAGCFAPAKAADAVDPHVTK